MKKSCLMAIVVAAATLGPTPAVAAEDKPRLAITITGVEQKAGFVAKLVNDSTAVRTIEASDDAEAKARLVTARALIGQARADIAAGHAAAADAKLNEALGIIKDETRRLSGEGVRQVRSEQLFAYRSSSIRALLDAYDRVLQEKQVEGTAAEKALVERNVAEADVLAARGEHEQALPLLDAAYASIAAQVARLRDGDTLVKELKFASAEEEYDYEIKRNDSHQFLLTLTLAEKQPDAMIVTQAAKMRAEARQLRERAEALAKAGKHNEAIGMLNDATTILIRSMRMTGAYIPG